MNGHLTLKIHTIAVIMDVDQINWREKRKVFFLFFLLCFEPPDVDAWMSAVG